MCAEALRGSEMSHVTHPTRSSAIWPTHALLVLEKVRPEGTADDLDFAAPRSKGQLHGPMIIVMIIDGVTDSLDEIRGGKIGAEDVFRHLEQWHYWVDLQRFPR